MTIRPSSRKSSSVHGMGICLATTIGLILGVFAGPPSAVAASIHPSASAPGHSRQLHDELLDGHDAVGSHIQHFAAGMSSAPSGSLPVASDLNPVTPGEVVEVSATGITGFDSSWPPSRWTPDGAKAGVTPAQGYTPTVANMGTDVLPYSGSGVSGIMDESTPGGRQMFLVGVFTGASAPSAPPPPCLDFSNAESFNSESPRARSDLLHRRRLLTTGHHGSTVSPSVPRNCGSGSPTRAGGKHAGSTTTTIRVSCA